MTNQRKHLTPLNWQKEEAAERPHRQVKIVGQKKIGQEPQSNQEFNEPAKNPKK